MVLLKNKQDFYPHFASICVAFMVLLPLSVLVSIKLYHKSCISRLKSGFISENHLTKIIKTTENSSSFYWHHSKEFTYHSMKFDVIYSEVCIENETILYCYEDKKEAILDTALNDLCSLFFGYDVNDTSDFAKKILKKYCCVEKYNSELLSSVHINTTLKNTFNYTPMIGSESCDPHFRPPITGL